MRLNLRAHHHQPRFGELPRVRLRAFTRLSNHCALLATGGASGEGARHQHQQKQCHQHQKRNATGDEFLRVAVHGGVNQRASVGVEIDRLCHRMIFYIDHRLRFFAEHVKRDDFVFCAICGSAKFADATLHFLQLRDALLHCFELGGELLDTVDRLRRIVASRQFARHLLQRAAGFLDVILLRGDQRLQFSDAFNHHLALGDGQFTFNLTDRVINFFDRHRIVSNRAKTQQARSRAFQKLLLHRDFERLLCRGRLKHRLQPQRIKWHCE